MAKKDAASATPPRGQKSLTSFFGAAKSSKTGKTIPPKKVQSGIVGALKKQGKDNKGSAPAKKDDKKKKELKKASDKVTNDSEKEKEATEKENVENDEEKKDSATSKPAVAAAANDLMDTDEEDEEDEGDEAPQKPAAKKSAPAKKAAPVAKKVKSDNFMDTDDDNDKAEEEEEEAPKKAAVKKSARSSKAAPVKETKKTKKRAAVVSRKRVIEDDSDEEQEEEEAADVKDDDDDEEEEYNNDDDEVEEDSDDETVDLSDEEALSPKKSSKKDSNDSPSSKSKKQKTLTGKAAPTKSIKVTKSSNNASTKSELAAKAMKSNSQLSKIMLSETSSGSSKASIWQRKEPTPYSALCETFGEIEAISGRLDIQEKLTMLFRKVLLRDGGGDDGDKDEDAEMNDANDKKDDKNAEKKDRTSDLYTLLYLASNSVAPQHANVELGVGDSILIKAIGEASGTAPAMIKKKYEKEGDLGNVAMSAKGKQKTLVGFGRVSGPKRLSCGDVLKVFREIANTSGSQSQKWKVDKIKSLLVRAKDSEPKYIIRGLQGKLRIGLASTTVLASLAHAVVLTKPKGVEVLGKERLAEIRALDGTEEAYPDFARKLCSERALPLDVRLETTVAVVKKAYMEVPSYDSLLDALLNEPLQEVHKSCTLTPGIPVAPMLAKPTKSVQEVLKRLNGLRFTCEYKYDGERAQVHMTPDGETKVFSRSLLNTSEKFPEVPLYVRESCDTTSVTSFVLDTEVVAFNRETKQFVPFQVLSTRKRTEESAESAKVQVIVQAFDLMYLNGKSLLDKTLAERRELMKKNFLPIEGKFQYATSLDHTENGDTAVIEEFLDAAVKGQCEGLMVKTLDDNATYQPNRRSLNWLKLKKDYLDGLGDSVDLVPLGAYHGRGKRTGVYGAYLLACYDQDTEEFQSVCKIGTGFSDEDLKELAASLKDHTIPDKSSQYNVSDTLECDVWFDAVQVWEVKAADLSKSSTHKGAIDKTGESGRGIGLRFPRFERVRSDKKPEEATSSDQILEMYYAQDSIVDNGGGMDMDGI